MIVKSVPNGLCEKKSPIFKFSAQVRKVIYTTNIFDEIVS